MRRRVSAAVVFVCALASFTFAVASSRADEAKQEVAEAPKPPAPKLEDTTTKRVTFEMATYKDNDGITVYTPSINASIDNVTTGASVRGSYLVDVVSAASVDIVSTASRRWFEGRQAGSLAFDYKPHDFGISAASSVSSEPDYLSYGFSSTMVKDLDEKNTSVTFGYGYSHDTIGRSTTPFSVFSRTVQRSSFNLGLTQLVNRSTVASASLDLIVEDGDQSKPYRYIPMFSADVAATVPKGASIEWVTANRLPERPLEQLPLTRRRFAVTGKLLHRFDTSTLRIEERLYSDSWDLHASTTDARWIFDLGRRFELWPHLRYHVQSAVDFWQRAYVSGAGWNLPEYRTGDRELGPLWTATGGAGIKYFLGSNADPQSFAISLTGDASYTSFEDDLYLTSRTAFLGTFTLEYDR